MNRFFIVLGCFVLALQAAGHAGPTAWPTNDQVPKSQTLLEVGVPSTLTGKGFVWSQHLSISGAIPLHMRWSTSMANPIGASWQVWAVTSVPTLTENATVVAKGTLTGPPGEFVIPADAFLSQQVPTTITTFMIQLTVRTAKYKTVSVPSNLVRVAQYPEVSSPPVEYWFYWEAAEDYTRETGHPVGRYVSYQPPTNLRPGLLTLNFVNPGTKATDPVYVEVNDTHGFVGRSQRMPTVPALAKGESKEVTLRLEFLRGVPRPDVKVSLKVFTRKVNAGGATDPWEQPQSTISTEWLALNCDGWGCPEQKVNARFEGYAPPLKNTAGSFTALFFNRGNQATYPVTAGLQDIKKHVVMGNKGGIPIPALRPGEMYRVVFRLLPTEPNGVPALPLDIQIVTAAVQPHVFTGRGNRCAGTGCPSFLFNYESPVHDDNGLLLNPIAHHQHNKSGNFIPQDLCAHLGDEGSPFPNCSNQWTYWQNVNYGGPGTVCGSEYGLGDGHFNFFPVTYTGHIKAHSCGAPDGDVCFDFRPDNVHILPSDTFKVLSRADEWQVVPGVHTGVVSAAHQWHLEMNSNATTDRFGSRWWTHYRDIADSPSFTTDASPQTCPKGFTPQIADCYAGIAPRSLCATGSAPQGGDCQSGATCMVPMVDENDNPLGHTCVRPVEQESVINNEAIVTGLASWDCMHGCEQELHPIYVLAIHMKDDPDDDVWAILLNNAGEQGSCGHKVIGAHLGDKKPFRLRLWRPTALRQEGMVVTSVVEAPGTQLMHPQNGPEKRSTVSLQGVDAIIDFSLPTPTADVIVSQFQGGQSFSGQGGDNASGFIEGELHLKWTAKRVKMEKSPDANGRSMSRLAAPPSSYLSESLIPRAFPAETTLLDSSVVRRFAVDKDEEVYLRLLEQAPPEKREALRASFIKPKATAAPPLKTLAPSGPPAATPPVKPEDPPLQWRRSAGPPGELVHDKKQIRALCEAFNGNIPKSPTDTCTQQKPTPP
jgi:hypothetical protein